jgi:hypothetical protein
MRPAAKVRPRLVKTRRTFTDETPKQRFVFATKGFGKNTVNGYSKSHASHISLDSS